MKSEKGFSLLEVIIAIALLGIVAVAFLGALATGSRVIFTADERATAESLSRSQMEYVRNQKYDATNNPPQYALMPNIPAGYNIVVSAERLDPKEDGTTNDDGIQKITVLVYHPYDAAHPEDYVVKLEDYRSVR
jgi:prepilin-type N-terminal cleavage/methylation domain-containing protein